MLPSGPTAVGTAPDRSQVRRCLPLLDPGAVAAARASAQRPAHQRPANQRPGGRRPLDAYEAILTGANEASRAGTFQEALQGYRDALDIIADITDPDTRDHLEIRCRSQKGFITIAADGYGSREAAEDFDRCAVLCRQLGSRPEHLSAIAGTYAFYMTRGELCAARRIAEDLQSWVHAGHDYYHAESALTCGIVSFFAGDFNSAGMLCDLAVNQFSSRPPINDAEQIWLLPHDATVAALAHQATVHWIAGRSRDAHNAGQRAIAGRRRWAFPRDRSAWPTPSPTWAG